MKGEAAVTGQLNTVLRDLLTAINQTFLHSRMSNDWGFSVLGEYEYKRSITLMKSADHVVDPEKHICLIRKKMFEPDPCTHHLQRAANKQK